jgi:Tol biopolymer transport system component
LAQPLDLSNLELAGEPVAIARGVSGAMPDYPGNPGFSISEDGVLAYHSITGARSQFAWLDRTGKRIAVVAPADVHSHPRLSSDAKRLAFDRPDIKTHQSDIWITDVSRGATSRLTYHPGSDGVPIWSPAGDRIVFNSIRGGARDLYWKSSAGGQEELLLKSGELKAASDWSSDGRFLLYCQGNKQDALWDIWVLPLFGDRKPFPVITTPFNETHAQFSPDGRWIVYVSDESGTPELYAQPFRPGEAPLSSPPERIQITNGGGTQPRWRSDGRELFYRDQNRHLIAVPVNLASKFEIGEPHALFQVRGARSFRDVLYDYDVTPDGQRFLFSLAVDGTVSPITVIVNWNAALK